MYNLQPVKPGIGFTHSSRKLIRSCPPPRTHCSQLHYQQQMPRFVHPHEVPMQGQFIPSYGQPHPHDVHLAPIQQPHDIAALQGHPHFVTQVKYAIQVIYWCCPSATEFSRLGGGGGHCCPTAFQRCLRVN